MSKVFKTFEYFSNSSSVKMRLRKLEKVLYFFYKVYFLKIRANLNRHTRVYVRSSKHTYRPINGRGWEEINWPFLQFMDSWHPALSTERGKGSKLNSRLYGKIIKSQTFCEGLKAFKICPEVRSLPKMSVNQEKLWPTNSQKQLFDNNLDSTKLHFKL